MKVFSNRHLLVCYYSFSEIRRHSKHGKIIYLLRQCYNAFLRKMYFDGDCKDFTFFISYDRKDHFEVLDQVYNQCNNGKSMIWLKWKSSFNIYNIGCFFKYIYKVFSLRSIENEFGIKEKLSLIDQVTLYFYLLQTVDVVRAIKRIKNLESMDCFTVLGDVWPPESILVEFFNDLSITTVSCQHGIFRPNVREHNVDVLNMLGVPSKIRLAWGDVHNNIFEKYSPSVKNIICGNPLLEPNTCEVIPKTIGVATDYHLFKDYNAKMLQIVQQFAENNGYSVKWRKHPNDSVENYTFNNSIIKLDSNLDDCEFIVAHTTTMFFSYLARGIKAIRYKSDVPFFDLDESIQFSNQKEFDDIVRDMDSIDFSQISKPFIECIGEESKKKYTSFFNSVI